MLLLTRRKNESITLGFADGRRVTIKVCRIQKERVKLGVDADETVAIWRTEIDDQSEQRRPTD